MASINLLKRISYQGAKYSLFFVHENHSEHYNDGRRYVNQGWSALTSIKEDDDEFFKETKELKNKYKLYVKSSWIGVFFTALLFFVPTYFLITQGYNMGILILVIFGVAGLIISLACAIAFGVALSRMNGKNHAESYLVSVNERVKNASGYDKVATSKWLNNFSLIAPAYYSNYTYQYSFKQVRDFVNSLNNKELEEFIVKGYEYGKTTSLIEEADSVLSSRQGTRFLVKEAEKKKAKLNEDFVYLKELRKESTQRFMEHLNKNSKARSNKINTRKEADESLLSFLSTEK